MTSTSTESGTEIKPCPICDGEAMLWNAREGMAAWISCMSRCVVLVSKEYKTDEEAITAWNHRPLEEAADKLAEALGQAKECIEDLGSGRGGWAWEEILDDLNEARADYRKARGME